MTDDPVTATAAGRDRYLHGAYHPNGQCPNGVCAEPRWFACCEDCGKAIVGDSSEAIRAGIAAHKMEGCDE